MSCTKCKNKKCGCNDQALTINPNFSNDPTICPPNSEPCSEVFDMACICYGGDDIVEYDIKKGDRLNVVLQKLILAISSPTCATFGDDTACESPINLIVTNITSSAFTISWNPIVPATSYTVEFKKSTETIWYANPDVAVPLTTDTIVGLTPDTVYDIQVKATCSEGTCYSLTIRIKTLIA